MQRLGALIAGGRRVTGLTQQQLADRAGVSVGAVRDLEQGRTSRPRRDTAETLAQVLDLDLDLWQVAEIEGRAAENGHPVTVAPGGAYPADRTAGGRVRVGVLGPLAVWLDGVGSDAGAGRQRAVLGLLAVHPGSAVHREAIIDAVWGQRPPASAVAMVQSYASKLRRLLGEGMLASNGTSYRLAVNGAQLDALEFAALAGEAKAKAAAFDPGSACAVFERALGLWRGEPLADVAVLRGHPAVAGLAQARAAAIIDYAEAALAAGSPERALPRLRELAATDPLDERAHARLMLALAGCGQQAAALAVFERLRQRLDQELGIAPGTELTDVHLRVLRGQLPARRSGAAGTAHSATRPRPHRDRGSIGPAAQAAGGTGRAGPRASRPDRPEPGPERNRADAAGLQDPARPGQQQTVPQPTTARRQPPARPPRSLARPRQLPAAAAHFTGRSSELAELAMLLDQAADSAAGTVVISAIGGMAGVGKTALAVHWAHQVAQHFPDGQLYVNLRGFGPSGVPATPIEAIRGFVDALGVPGDRIPPDQDAQAGLYRTMLAGRRMLIVLDNARDEQQVRPLLPASPGCLVIVTSRSELAGLVATDGASLLTLDVLTRAEARTLLAARFGDLRAAAEPDAITEIATLCAQLPLALAVVAARAAARPRFPLSALAAELRGTRGRLDALNTSDPAASVRTVFSWSYRQLGPATARMFRLLGIHAGPDISAPAAASMVGVALRAAHGDLRDLAATHLLTERAPGRFAFHDLLRAYATEQAAVVDDESARRAALCRILDHYLHTAHAAAFLLNPSRPPLTLAPARPGVTPERLADHRQALAWFEAEHQVLLAASAMAAGTGVDACAWQLPWAMADFLDRRGYWDESAAVQRNALAAATRLGDNAGQAAVSVLLAQTCARVGDYDRARAHLTECLGLCRLIGDRAGEARVFQTLCWVGEQQGRHADALAHAEQALALLRAIGDRAGEAHALNNVGYCHSRLGHREQADAFCRQALALHRDLGNHWGEAVAWDSLGYTEHQLGHLNVAAACYQRALPLFREFGDLNSEAEALIHLGNTREADGDQRAARDAWEQALAILDDLHHPDAERIRGELPPATRQRRSFG